MDESRIGFMSTDVFWLPYPTTAVAVPSGPVATAGPTSALLLVQKRLARFVVLVTLREIPAVRDPPPQTVTAPSGPVATAGPTGPITTTNIGSQ